jgi:hypothetical protein
MNIPSGDQPTKGSDHGCEKYNPAKQGRCNLNHTGNNRYIRSNKGSQLCKKYVSAIMQQYFFLN